MLYRLASRASSLLERAASQLQHSGFDRHRRGRQAIDVLRLPSDVAKSCKLYRAQFGKLPSFFRPRTFNEKLQQKKLFRRRAHYPIFADKIAVRDFVRERVGPDVLTKIYWVGLDLNEARHAPLPERFVVKPNHCSGAVLLVDDAAKVDWVVVRDFGRHWLEVDYSDGYGEWEYRWIPRRLFIEEYLEGPEGKVAYDYKFFCFHGKVSLVQVDVDRYGNRARAFFDRDFRERFPFRRGQRQYQGTLEKPSCFEEMREIAERLSDGESFVRVDLYDIGRPVFGELTLHPHGGHGDYDPADWDAHLGEMWDRAADVRSNIG